MDLETAKIRVENAYEMLGYDMGWRLLSCPWGNIRTAEVAIITMNPGGREYQAPLASVEAGSAYRLESWHGYPPGLSPLQRQLLRLCQLMDVEPD